MRVWVDCTAAAHPLVLRPIIERLEAEGHEVVVTARDYGQTLGILDRLGMPYTAIGEHGGASRLGKVRALAGARRGWRGWSGSSGRTLRSPTARSTSRSSPPASGSPRSRCRTTSTRGCSAGSRSARRGGCWRPTRSRSSGWRRIGARAEKLFRYPGLKEEYYLADFEPDPAVLGELGLDRERVLVVVRPPPETSEYHAPNDLYAATVRRLAAADGGAGRGHPPHREQGAAVRALGAANLIVPERAIDAQSLIAFADLVVSAGGTMNREAVALGTPVFTTFSRPHGRRRRGPDRRGRLRVLDDPAALRAAQARGAGRRPRAARPAAAGRGVLGALARSGTSCTFCAEAQPASRHGHRAMGPTTTDAVLAFVAATAIAWLLVPFAERLAFRVGAIDQPKERGLHDRPMPRLSGLAILVAVEAAGWIWLPGDGQSRSILLGAVAIAAVGVADDVPSCRRSEAARPGRRGDDPGPRRRPRRQPDPALRRRLRARLARLPADRARDRRGGQRDQLHRRGRRARRRRLHDRRVTLAGSRSRSTATPPACWPR